MKTFKAIWKWLRAFLFIVVFLICAVLCLPCAIMVGQGNFTLVYMYLVVFVVGLVIQALEYKAGWLDEYYDWKN